MPNYNSSIIAGLKGPTIPGMRKPTQVQGTSRFSGRPLPTQGTLQPDPSLDVFNFNESMGQELREREFNNARVAGLGGDDINVNIAKASAAPLAGLRKSYADENESSALGRQGQQLQDWEDFDREAISLGFNGEGLGERTLSPGQARNMYAREMDEYKTRVPLLQEQARGQWERDKASLTAQGALAVEGSKANTERAKLQEYAALARTLGAPGQQNERQISRMGLPGGFSVSFADEDEVGEGGIPTRLLTDLAFQRYAASAARTDRERQAAEGSYIQSQLNALNAARNVDPNIKAWVSDLIVDPEYRGMAFEDILDAYMASGPSPEETPTPEELAAASSLFRTIRGK
jgi:hypothetical protein